MTKKGKSLGVRLRENKAKSLFMEIANNCVVSFELLTTTHFIIHMKKHFKFNLMIIRMRNIDRLLLILKTSLKTSLEVSLGASLRASLSAVPQVTWLIAQKECIGYLSPVLAYRKIFSLSDLP